MLNDPATDRLERFAVQRVRIAEAIVEVHQRTPGAVFRLVYEMLRFDGEGRLDCPAFIRQTAAVAELAVDRVLGRSSTRVAVSSPKVVAGSLRRRWSSDSCLPRSAS